MSVLEESMIPAQDGAKHITKDPGRSKWPVDAPAEVGRHAVKSTRNTHPVLVNTSATSHLQGPNASYSDMGLIRADALRR